MLGTGNLIWAQAEAQAGGRAVQRVDALEQTRALADTLAADKDGRFAQSKFLQFVSKMSRGEIILEGNEVRAALPDQAALQPPPPFGSKPREGGHACCLAGSNVDVWAHGRGSRLKAEDAKLAPLTGGGVFWGQAKEVSPEAAAWAGEFAGKQQQQQAAARSGEFEDVWNQYGEVPCSFRILSLSTIVMPLPP